MNIPEQLKGYSFCKLGASKRPFETGWQNKPYKYNETQRWLNDGNRYGVIGGYNDLIMLDFDSLEAYNFVKDKFRPTFTVLSGGKQLPHLYYRTDKPQSFKILDANKDTLLDIQGKGKQCVGPGCKHESGKYYVVDRDIAIAYMPMAEIKATLDKIPIKKEVAGLKEKKPQKTETEQNEESHPLAVAIKSKVSFEMVLNHLGIDTSKNPTSCPAGHESKGGACFSYSEDLGVGNCFHCGFAGDVIKSFQTAQGLTFMTACKQMNKIFGLDLDLTSKEFKIKKKKEDKKGIDYDRIDEEVEFLVEDKHIVLHPQTEKLYYYTKSGYTIYNEYEIDDLINAEFGSVCSLNNTLRCAYLRALKMHAHKLGRKIIPITDIDISNNKKYIQFGKMLFDLSRNQVIEATPEVFIPCPIVFEPSTDIKTPIIDKIFNEISPIDKNGVGADGLKDRIAYMMYRDNPLKAIHFFYGPRNSGKSTFWNIVQRLLGDDNTTTSMFSILSDTKQRFELGNLKDKLAVFCSEIESKELTGTSVLKTLSGNDHIRGEIKNVKTTFSFKAFCNLCIACNDLPSPKDVNDDAYHGRCDIIEFPISHNPKGKKIEDEIPINEFNNLAAYCVSRLTEWVSTKNFELINFKDFDERIIESKSRTNPMEGFVEQFIDIDYNEYGPDFSKFSIERFKIVDKFNDFLTSKGKYLPSRKQVLSLFRKTVGEDNISEKKKRIDDLDNPIWFVNGVKFK